MQNMSWQQRGYGYQGGWGPHPGFFILPMILMGFLFVVALKFLWPLLLFGLVFMIVRRAMFRHAFGHGERSEWSEWKEKRREWMKQHGHPGWQGEGRWGHGFGPRGHFGHHGHPGEHGKRGPWGWDSDEEQPKRKNEDDGDDDKPKRDGNTLYV